MNNDSRGSCTPSNPRKPVGHPDQPARNSFCRGCFKIINRPKGKKFCSQECSNKKIPKKCEIACKEFIDIPLVFSDGSKHVKRVCTLCRQGRYVSKNPIESKKRKEIFRNNWIQNDRKNLKSKFYLSREWRELRYSVLERRGNSCECCRRNDLPIHVDHIQPRSLRPDLELDESNLQILCVDCNIGKGNRYSTDWRNTNNSA